MRVGIEIRVRARDVELFCAYTSYVGLHCDSCSSSSSKNGLHAPSAEHDPASRLSRESVQSLTPLSSHETYSSGQRHVPDQGLLHYFALQPKTTVIKFSRSRLRDPSVYSISTQWPKTTTRVDAPDRGLAAGPGHKPSSAPERLHADPDNPK